ncbi:MAG: elongation factor P [Acidobacteriota bacterium]
MSVKATQIRQGMLILREGELFRVDSVNHVTPGKGRAHVQTLLRNLRTGAAHDHRFRSDDFVERAVMDQVEMEYLYQEGDHYIFMNTETYEQVPLTSDVLGNTLDYLLPNGTVRVEFHDGTPMGVSLPLSVRLKIVETEPPLKGATAAGSPKPATLETGLTVSVPQFIEVGEIVEVDTRNGAYITRG